MTQSRERSRACGVPCGYERLPIPCVGSLLDERVEARRSCTVSPRCWRRSEGGKMLEGASRRRHNQCGLVLHFPATPSMCTCCVRGPAGLAPHTQSIFYSMYACHSVRSD
ncbi:unnamed protein product [Trichogramma brassicae]|uniref:Uncharacterized protein n=2 Tax=Trichogramma brassicae TaxID=86971 RepID=A0A6H5JBY7_9HYME|nr:unnamed protein product [Trichogramma brassicae]